MRELVRAMNPDIPVVEVETVEALLAEANARVRFATFLMWTFAAIATILSLIDVYGTFRYAVRQRTHEIGVRIAFGAAPNDIVMLVLRMSAAHVLAGLAIACRSTI